MFVAGALDPPHRIEVTLRDLRHVLMNLNLSSVRMHADVSPRGTGRIEQPFSLLADGEEVPEQFGDIPCTVCALLWPVYRPTVSDRGAIDPHHRLEVRVVLPFGIAQVSDDLGDRPFIVPGAGVEHAVVHGLDKTGDAAGYLVQGLHQIARPIAMLGGHVLWHTTILTHAGNARLPSTGTMWRVTSEGVG